MLNKLYWLFAHYHETLLTLVRKFHSPLKAKMNFSFQDENFQRDAILRSAERTKKEIIDNEAKM